MAKKPKKAKRKTKKKQPTYYGYIVFNERGRYEHITGYFCNPDHATNAASDYLKGHPSWTAKVVEHRVLKTISFDPTPIISST